MTSGSGRRIGALVLIAGLVVVALAGLHVIATQPWNAAASAACGSLAESHVVAQVVYLEAQVPSDSELGAARDTSFAELGMTCGWEEAQAADMAAYVVLLDAEVGSAG